MRGLRQLTAMVGALMTAFALLLLGAPPSAAGGPTSVLLASPTSHRTASLHGTQEEYGRLEKLLAPAGSALDQSREEAPEWGEEGIWGEQSSDMVNVTWMAHDVTPWRVDRVHTAAKDTQNVWIHTTLGMGGATGAPGNGVWHRAKQPEELRKLLLGLGVLGDASGDRAQGELPSTDAPAEPRADTGERIAGDKAATSAPDLADSARWAIPALGLGLLLGSGATLLLRRAAARHESGPPRGPRQELIDA